MTTLAPHSDPLKAPDAGATQRRLWGLVAEFDDPSKLLHAAEKVRDAGYRWWDCHTPFPVHGLDAAMGVRRTLLPVLVFGGGLTGATLGLVLQAFTNASNLTIWALVWVTRAACTACTFAACAHLWRAWL